MVCSILSQKKQVYKPFLKKKRPSERRPYILRYTVPVTVRVTEPGVIVYCPVTGSWV